MKQGHEFNYLRCMMNNRGTEKVEGENKIMNKRRVGGGDHQSARKQKRAGP